jgi:hypothetical protein
VAAEPARGVSRRRGVRGPSGPGGGAPRPALGAHGIRLLAIWARTRAGRYLIVVLRATEVSHDWLIVGAMEMTAVQVAEYDRWEADHEW